MDLCDYVCANPAAAKDIVKTLKKRLASKTMTVQLLTLTVLESLMKNGGDAIAIPCDVRFEAQVKNLVQKA